MDIEQRIKKTDRIVLQTDIVPPMHVTTPKNYLNWAPCLKKMIKSIDREIRDQNRRGSAEEIMRLVIMGLSMLDDLGYERELPELKLDVYALMQREEEPR